MRATGLLCLIGSSDIEDTEAVTQIRKENNLLCGVRCSRHITGMTEQLDTSEGDLKCFADRVRVQAAETNTSCCSPLCYSHTIRFYKS
jgi:hypothetical protein